MRSGQIIGMTDALIAWFQHFGVLTPVSVAALCCVFFGTAFVVLPRTPLVVAASATFGLAVIPIVMLSGTAGGIVAFSLSRYVASDWFRRRLEARPMLRTIAQAVDEEGWRIIALMRLGAPLPSAVQNYLFGLTRINIVTYSIATLIFASPQVILFSFLGATGRAALLQDDSSGLPLAFPLLAVLLAVAVLSLLTWGVRKSLLRFET